MTREQCEMEICKSLEKIRDIYLQYHKDPDDVSLSLYISSDCVFVNNRYWDEMDGEAPGEDQDHPLNAHKYKGEEVIWYGR